MAQGLWTTIKRSLLLSRVQRELRAVERQLGDRSVSPYRAERLRWRRAVLVERRAELRGPLASA